MWANLDRVQVTRVNCLNLKDMILIVTENIHSREKSIHNKDGYYEQTKMSLLCDQLIRMKYGMGYSFLFPPKFDSTLKYTFDYNYDINRDTLLYEENTPWEWGIERMTEGQKWHNCYKKFNVDTYKNMIFTIDEYNYDYSKNDKSIIKDPRLIFVLNYFDFNYKLLVLERNSEKVKASCKKHYGENMFEKSDGIVSNFFNHKIKYMGFDEFRERYQNAINHFYNKNRDIRLNIEDYTESELRTTIRNIQDV